MSQTGGDGSITMTGDGEVLAGSYSTLEDYHVEDAWILGRVAADHIFRHDYEAGEVEFGEDTVRIKIPHDYRDGRLTIEYRADETGEVGYRRSLLTPDKGFNAESADAMDHHMIECEFKRLVARANKVAWFADEIIDMYGRNPQVAEDILREYRWGPVIDPRNLACNITRLRAGEQGSNVPVEAVSRFGSSDHVYEAGYETIYDALLDRAAAGEQAGTFDFEEGTKGRSLKDFYRDTVRGEDMRRIYVKEINHVIRKVRNETDMDIDTL